MTDDAAEALARQRQVRMTDDYLVAQLRKRVISVNGQGHLPDSLCREAADEIERLTNIIEGYDYYSNNELTHWINKQ